MCKLSIAGVEQDRGVVVVVVGEQGVGPAVPVEISDRDKIDVVVAGLDRRRGRGCELTLAIAEQHGHGAYTGLAVGDQDIEIAITVYIGGGRWIRTWAAGEDSFF